MTEKTKKDAYIKSEILELTPCIADGCRSLEDAYRSGNGKRVKFGVLGMLRWLENVQFIEAIKKSEE